MTHASHMTADVLARVDGAADLPEARNFTRLAAVEHQLNMAIRAYIQFDDLVSAMTLAGAAERVLSDLQPPDGLLGVDAWSVEGFANLYIVDNFRTAAKDQLRHAYDFLRHADGRKGEGKGPTDSLTLNQTVVDFFLLLGVSAYTTLARAQSGSMRAFRYWMMTEHPNWFREGCPGRNEMAAAQKRFPNLSKADRFSALLAVVESQSLIPKPQSPL